jgi:two-component system cell cycle sensor histidine kinase/response regulator CckA
MKPGSATPNLPMELYVSLFEQAADGMFIADLQGTLIAANPCLYGLLGFAVEEVLGRPLTDFVDLEDLRTNPLRFDELSAGKAVLSERLLRCASGRPIRAELTTRMLANGYLVGVVRDLTERQRAEEESKANHLRMLSVLDANAAGVYVADPETYEVLYANRALVEIFGVPEQRRCYEYLQHRDAPCPFCTNDRIFGENLGKTVVWEFQNEATGRWFRCLDRAITWPDGRVVRYEMATDLTDRKQAEEALRESEELLAKSNQILSGVLEHTHMMAVFLDVGFNFVWVNRAYADTCGHPVSFFPGKNHFDLYPSEENQAIFQRVLDTGEPSFVVAKPFEFPDQPWRGVTWWDWSVVPTRHADGTVAGLVYTLAEVTDQIRATEALKESEERYRTLVEEASDGIVITDAQGLPLSANPALLEMLGYSSEELLKLRIRDVVATEEQKNFPALLAAISSGTMVLNESRLVRKDGSQVLVEVSARMLPDGRRLAIVRDVTGRRVAERAMEEEERPYGVVFADLDFRILRVNSVFGRLLGYAPEELIGKSIAELTLPDDHDDTREQTGRLKRREIDQFAIEKRYVTRSGGMVHAVTFVRGLYAATGGFDGTVAFVVDITARARAEELRLEMERRLLHSQKLESLGILAGGIAHDFNNLLMAMLGNLELAQRDLSPVSPVLPLVDAASHAARRAADLTRQMLAYSGRGKFLVARLDLNELVEENLQMLRTSIPRTVTLNLHLDRALPAVEADAGQIQQVAMNLITNAAESIGNDPGVITLSTGVRDCDGSYLSRNRLDETPAPGRYAYFEVQDSGSGMDEETRKRVFEPFFTTKFTGRGLGLPAVYGIVRGHGGAILLDSAPGKGTTIRVLFPAAAEVPGGLVAEEAPPAGAAGAAPDMSRGTILIVDDEEMVLKPCAAMVESMGFAVLTAVDGEQAVEQVRRHGAEIQAIILDLTMPKLDGAGALERILRIEPGAKVILSSGYDEAEATQRIAKGALAGFIRKPFGLKQLQSALERALEDGGAHPQSP